MSRHTHNCGPCEVFGFAIAISNTKCGFARRETLSFVVCSVIEDRDK